jgi:predicted RNA-binding protein
MCLSTVYKGTSVDPEQLVSEYVTEVEVVDGALRIYDITGNILDVPGTLQKVDLIKSTIFIA